MNDQLLHPSRILVVDDQEANALLLQAVLARAGYTAVETMTDPMAVVAALHARQPPDLLLLDWHMPGAAAPRSSRTSHSSPRSPTGCRCWC